MGFSEVVHVTLEQAQERYLRDRHDGLTGRYGEQLMLVSVRCRATTPMAGMRPLSEVHERLLLRGTKGCNGSIAAVLRQIQRDADAGGAVARRG